MPNEATSPSLGTLIANGVAALHLVAVVRARDEIAHVAILAKSAQKSVVAEFGLSAFAVCPDVCLRAPFFFLR